ncbi:metal-dependent hydrolase family protein [Marinicella rhabdoformis]|uniref:metal-dependent hydrolase family protein n=1 Tax=Marinicella rhabdoformis TaxID=2580566 RepID=UPI0012AEDC26|nr:amidohydrolase family protein [Marinicella rhabdoformis]
MKIKSLLYSILLVTGVNAETTYIHAGTLLDVPGESPKSNQTLIIKDGVIDDVQAGFVVSEEADVNHIDLKHAFVMPGMMDMHVHISGERSKNSFKEGMTMSDELQAFRIAHYGMKTLKTGFTTVRDVGSRSQSMYAYRDAVNRGWIDGPRVIAAGGVGITGGHADVSGIKPDLMEFYTDRSICDGPYDCRRATRDAIKYGADLIKITSTGGVMTVRATGTGQQMEMDELKEVVLAAKRMGRKVASHAHAEDGIVAALEAGVHSIEHGSYAGPKAHKLFKKTGAYLVPTLLAGHTVVKMAKETDILAPSVKEKALRVGHDMKGNFIKSYNAGVKIAFGTDSGVSLHGENMQEAVLMSEAGMPNMAVLKSATVHGANLIGMSDQLGTLEKGKQADIIAMPASPVENIKALLDVDFVMKGGKVYKQ